MMVCEQEGGGGVQYPKISPLSDVSEMFVALRIIRFSVNGSFDLCN